MKKNIYKLSEKQKKTKYAFNVQKTISLFKDL